MKLPTWDEIDAMVEGDPLKLRDLAASLVSEAARLQRTLTEIADYDDKVMADPRNPMLTSHAVTAIGNTARQAVTS